MNQALDSGLRRNDGGGKNDDELPRRIQDFLLGLGEVEDQPALNSFFRDASTRRAQTAGVLDLLRRLDAAGEKALLVTHQVNITALTGFFPASGEILVTRLEDGRLRALARIKTAAR